MRLAESISPPSALSGTQISSSRKSSLFIGINALIMVMVATAMVFNDDARIGNAIYIVALAMICTSPFIFMKSYRGKQSLMMVFLAYYFGSFALKDISDLLLGKNIQVVLDAGTFITGGEVAILIGAAFFVAGYSAVSTFFPERDTKILARDWSPGSRIIIGLLFWSIGFFITFGWQLSGADLYSGVKASSNPFTGVIIMFRILQPLGTLVLIYHYLVSKSRLALAILIMTMIADFIMGFVGDSKELAVRDLLLYLVSLALLRERIPIYQLIVFVIVAGMSFSFFSAYRVAVHSKHESRLEALSNIEKHVGSIAGNDSSIGERFTGGLEYFTDRITLKSSVEQIIARTGKDVGFQNGRTIEPLLYAFIPRFIWPDKPSSSMAGQVFNQEFKISASKNTYISTSQVGELYWNFGWTGLVVGMMMIGAVMAAIASSMRLDKDATLPRFLFILMTVYLLSLRFETAIAEVYVVWGRAVLLLLLLNALIPKVRGQITEGSGESKVSNYSDCRLARVGGATERNS